MIRSDSKFEIGDGNLPCESFCENFESPLTSTFANKYALVRSFPSSSVVGCSEKSTVNTKIQFFGPSLDDVMLI